MCHDQLPILGNIKHGFANNRLLKQFIPKKSLKGVQQYWSQQNVGDNNAYTDYLKNREGRRAFAKVVNRYVTEKDTSILEVGCNVGSNLNTLSETGYRNLSGIEINPKAVEAMKAHYPEMAKNAKVYNSSIEDKIKDFKDNEFGLVFSLAVLMHIHTDSDWIFGEMVRITKEYLIVFEDESGQATKNFPRNYKTIFEKLGMTQIEFIDTLPHWRPSYKTRIFRKTTHQTY